MEKKIKLEQTIQEIIVLSKQLLTQFDCYTKNQKDESMPELQDSVARRDRLLRELFGKNSKDSLAAFSNELSKVSELDKQLTTQANITKSTLAKQVIKQKKNNKATNAYRTT